MGGSIRVVTIFEGKIFPQTRWTNPNPFFVKNLNFLICKKEHIEEYLNDYEKCDGYSENEESFSPNGYGLDVFDFDKKIIYSTQCYCSYDTISYSMVYNELASMFERKPEPDDRNYYPNIARELWDNNAIYIDNKRGYYSKDNLSFDASIKMFEKYYRDKNSPPYPEYHINWEKFGWKTFRFQENKEESKKMFDELKKNYSLTEKDVKEWEIYLKEKEHED
jgi:hypothetical protein